MIAQQPSGGAQIFDRKGNLLYEYVDDRSGLRSPVKLDEISPWMIAATVSTEDASFWTNPGVNTRGLVRAGLEALHLRSADAASTTGGSSITQQLVKNVYIPPEERYERSYKRKLKETIYARRALGPLLEEPDPRVVPEPDLVRRALQRRRGGVAGLLRQAREGSDAAGGGDARGHPGLPVVLRPGQPSRSSDRSAATRCCG